MSVGYCSDDETPFSIFDFLDVYTDLVDCVVKVNVVNVVYDKVYTVTEVAMEEILTCLRECFTLSGDGGLCLGFECTAQLSIANGLETFKTSGTPISADISDETLVDLCRCKSSLLDFKISMRKQLGTADICSLSIYIDW